MLLFVLLVLFAGGVGGMGGEIEAGGVESCTRETMLHLDVDRAGVLAGSRHCSSSVRKWLLGSTPTQEHAMAAMSSHVWPG